MSGEQSEQELAATPKHPGGRPSSYSSTIADAICQRLALGDSLRSICEDDEMPAMSTVFRWLGIHQEFSEQYARARETQADTLADEILNIADDGHNDWMRRKFGDDERWVENGEAIRRSQLRIDSRKWLAGKMRPKKYGDKIVQEQTGADGGAVKHEHLHRIERVIVGGK
jgi:hypothetical protein